MNIKSLPLLLIALAILITPLRVLAEDIEVDNIYQERQGLVENLSLGKDGDVFLFKPTVDTEKGEIFYIISDETLILSTKEKNIVDKDQLKDGLKVKVFVKSNTPVMLSNPPKQVADLIVIEDGEDIASPTVDRFDEENLNHRKDLKLILDEEVEVLDREGKKLDISKVRNRDLAIFHTVVTASLPGQTHPERIIVLNSPRVKTMDRISINGEILELEKEIRNIDGVDMVPLRAVAEKLSYDIKWNGSDKTVELNKGPHWHLITIGKNQYNFARMNIELERGPILEEGHTLVPLSFFEDVLRVKARIDSGFLVIEE